jgi:transcriptional regulator with XRE-family HTH domain
MGRNSTKNPLFDKALGKKIRDFRISKNNISLNKLNSLAGLNLTKSALSNIELGKQQLTSYQLFNIARALNFSVDEVFRELGETISILGEGINVTIKNKNKKLHSLNIEQL